VYGASLPLSPGFHCTPAIPEVLSTPKLEREFQCPGAVNQVYSGGFSCPASGRTSSTISLPRILRLLVAIANAFSKASLRLRLDFAAYQAAPRLGVPRSRGMVIPGDNAARRFGPFKRMRVTLLWRKFLCQTQGHESSWYPGESLRAMNRRMVSITKYNPIAASIKL
jgi:hypothetical protein